MYIQKKTSHHISANGNTPSLQKEERENEKKFLRWKKDPCLQSANTSSEAQGLVGVSGRVWRGHETHSTRRQPGQLSVQVRERKTSRVAVSAASSVTGSDSADTRGSWKATQIHWRGQSYTHSMHSSLPPLASVFLSFLFFLSEVRGGEGGEEEGGGRGATAWENKNNKKLAEKREWRKMRRQKGKREEKEEEREDRS